MIRILSVSSLSFSFADDNDDDADDDESTLVAGLVAAGHVFARFLQIPEN